MGSTFWLSLDDFVQYFYISTICYHSIKHNAIYCSDQVFSYKWGACYVDMPHTEFNTLVQLFQMNDRFMDANEVNIVDDYEYAEMQLIVTKAIKLPPHTGQNHTFKTLGECAYIDGTIEDLYNTCHVKIEKMTAGRYIFFYTAKFRRDQLCRKLNVILNCEHEHDLKLTRISARKFGTTFLNRLERKNLERSWEEDKYQQPYY